MNQLPVFIFCLFVLHHFIVLFLLYFQAAALKGDGYSGRPSPHSPSETFQGVTVIKAVKVCSSLLA